MPEVIESWLLLFEKFIVEALRKPLLLRFGFCFGEEEKNSEESFSVAVVSKSSLLRFGF